MMTDSFCCPKCKTPIVIKTDGYSCQNCGGFYPLRDGYVDFIGDVEFYAGEVSQEEMQILIQDIDSLGYETGLTRFFEHNPSYKYYVTDPRRIDWVSHCLGKNNLRCLDIGSGLGNISHNLSHIYQEVYSLEAVRERIEFQKRKYKNSNRSNITVVRGNAIELPFQDNYFDLVVCNGVMEWIGMMNTDLPPREAQLSFLREVKRVLSSNGCLYIGIENRFSLWFLLGGKDHSGLRYTSLLPRRIASAVVRKFGYYGGIYGGKSKQKEQKGYYTYTYSIWGYRSLLQQAGFKFKSYWVVPSYNKPHFSGKLEDKIGLKAFLHYFQSNVAVSKTALSIIKKLNNSLVGLITSLFIPCFLFYCYKNGIQESVDDIITGNLSLQNYMSLSERNKILYFLYDKKGKPLKVARLKRYGYSLPNTISFHDATKTNSRDTSERLSIEDWVPGKRLNLLKLNEMKSTIDWLIDFQNKTRRTKMTKNDIYSEVAAIRTNLLKISDLNTQQYGKWLDDYQSYVVTLDIYKTAEHGDFSYVNILIDSNTHKINVIDWEYYREEGNPFFDFIFLIITGMQSMNYSEEEFEANLNGSGRFIPILRELKSKINNHFGFELNLDILIRYVMLRLIIRNWLEGGPFNNNVIRYRRMLHILSSKT